MDSSIEAVDDVDLLAEVDTFASLSETIAAPSLHSNPVTSPCTTTSKAPSLSPTSFDRFRTSTLPRFPFAHFPTDLTVERLFRDRPLLSQAMSTANPTDNEPGVYGFWLEFACNPVRPRLPTIMGTPF